jgi:hypothetical protein
MFEIGNSLHEARIRQGLDLGTVEAATKIRAKYVKALEEEQFETLPAQTYVKGFLRTYADYLGLDGQLYVDEYSSRFVVGEDDRRPLRPRRSAVQPQRDGFQSSVVLITLAAIGLVAALVIVAWKSGGGGTHLQNAASTGVVTAPAVHTHVRTKPTVARLVLVARRGNSLLEVHAGSAAGRLLYQGTLLRGKTVPLSGKRLWVDATNVQNLDAKLNGHTITLGRGHGHQTVVVSPTAVQLASPAPLG